ncbi:Drug resistance transporter, EmrB/QacA subfamily [uncultured Desulfobacterium sp.]|uniref:Drug resistance transporter, EmrB/QacA subfamily n=1 Tax=uncultured Desulfobacterium sp. TaxID=201089 RepID=A0A445N0X9_9BACT|nr:Drug resistance transporter, EmrB/QacA subfamily [uncultured Desulfobacterium sp.]
MKEMSDSKVAIVTLGVMLSLFMSAIEMTVVATAMPTIVNQLGGLNRYSWVFSAYMVASTTTIPIYGKFSDTYGRKTIFLIAMALFLTGSMLSGQSHSMDQLICFRTLQGMGAGGLMPLSFIIIGDMFSFEERARMQGFFSGVWGFASIVGPLLGGFLVDKLSWRWVFYVNLLPGCLASILLLAGLREGNEKKAHPRIDYLGAVLLTSGVVVLLLSLFQLGTFSGLVLLISSAILFIALVVAERAAADPILPLTLFRERLFAVGIAHGILAGWVLFGSTSFVPLFVQLSLEKSATVAGSALTPQMLGWVFSSVIGTRLLLHYSYRTIVLVGMVLLTLGALFMSLVTTDTSIIRVMLNMVLMGVGMGLTVPAFMIAIQNSVDRNKLGTATATLQFSRVIGGALGVSVMGLILSVRLAANLKAAGVHPEVMSLQDLMKPFSTSAAAADATLRGALTGAVESVFVAALAAAVVGLVVTAFTPKGGIRRNG